MPPDILTAARLIPVVQKDIARHVQHEAANSTPQSGDYIEWKNILEDLQDFLADLQKLAAPPQPRTADNPPSIMSTESILSIPSTDPAPPAATLPVPTTKEEHAAWIAAAKARCAARAAQNKNENTAPNTPAGERDLQPQSDTGERAGERPPSEGRATPERDPIDPRATTIEEMDRHPIFGMLTRARSEDKIKQARAEYLAELQRERASRSPIDNLSPERQQMLFEMLEENTATAVAEMIAEPEPLGWNFKIHASSLKRFRERYKLQLAKAERLRVVTESTQTVEQFGPGHQKAIDAANNLVKLRFFDAARDAQTSTRDLHILSRILDRQRRTDLAERKQNLAETK